MTNDNDEWNEFQREHVRRGKGSRGGVGSRKRRNGGNPLTRKNSDAEVQRVDDRIASQAKRHAREFLPGEKEALTAMLTNTFNLDVSRSPWTLWEQVHISNNRMMVRNADKAYRDALAYAYAVYCWVICSEDVRTHVLAMQEKCRIKVSGKFNLLATVLECVIDYSRDGKLNLHALSRDCQAIRYLISQTCSPYAIEAFYEEYRGGPDKWSRLVSKTAVSAETKQTQTDVRACKMERDELRRSKVAAEAEDFDDDEEKGPFKWAEVDIAGEAKEQHQLQKLAGGGLWESQMLLYFAREMKIRPEEAMISMVVGDPQSPLGVRLIATRSIGHVVMESESMAWVLDRWILKARRLLRPYSPGSWLEAAWRHDNPPPRRR
jgi:hypothetical protein